MTASRAGFRQAWQHRRWRALLGSTAVSGIGDWLYFTAFAVWLYNRTGSAGWLGAAATVRMLVYVVLGPIGGAMAARYPRRDLMVVLDIGRAAVMVVLAVVVGVDGSPVLGTAVVVVASVLTVPYRPALAAATPYVVPESSLAAANGAEAVVGQLTVFAGPALATLILAVASAPWAMAVNAATFVFAALLIGRVGDLGGRPARPDPEPAAEGVAGDVLVNEAGSSGSTRAAILGEVAEGWKVLVSVPGLFILNALVVLTILAFGAEGILHVLAAEEQLGRGAEFVGALTAAIGIGGLVIAPLTGRIAGSSSPGPWLVACAVLQGVPLVALGFVSSPVIALGVLAIEGVGVILFEVLAITLLQRLAGDRLSQVFGIQDSMSAAAQLLGGVGAPILVAAFGLSTACAVAGGALVLFGVVGAPALLRCGRIAEDRAQELAPIVAELLTLGLFEGAPRAAVEAVAAAITSERVGEGTVVVAEDDPADDLFVIRSGTFSAATRTQGTLRLMTTGEWFGEIGILESRPRTASVVAETEAELWRIPGDAFLDALRELSTMPSPLHRGVTARLVLSSVAGGPDVGGPGDREPRDVPFAS